MSIDFDMSEIAQLFIEESMEGLDIMETGLLNLDYGAADPETMNGIFRAAHSIKGGSATLGFLEISEFAHHVETLLDEMRQGKREVKEASVQLLLQSVDCIRAMVNDLANDEEVDTTRAEELEVQLAAMLNGGAGSAPAEDGGGSSPASEAPAESANVAESDDTEATPVAAEPASAPGETGGNTWKITFEPSEALFMKGNDPVLLFKALDQLGSLKVEAKGLHKLDFDRIDPELCVLSWVLELCGDVNRESISEVFAWIDEESKVKIELLEGDGNTVSSDGNADAPAIAPDTEEAPGTASADEAVTQPAEPAATETGAEAENAAQSNSAESNSAESKPAESRPAEPQSTEPKPAEPKAAESKPAKANKASAAKKAGAKKPPAKKKESGSIRVNISKIDALINLVGELVITQSMLNRFGDPFDNSQLEQLREGLSQLERNTRDLQESVMQIRMLPISFAFSRFPRLVHDISLKLGKKVDLQLSGEDTELDKTVLEKIGDPLVHLVRNSLDHGLESPEIRAESGKDETGVLKLNAYHKGGSIVIEVIDDGAGINKEKVLAKARERGLVGPEEELSDDRIYNLIFMAGFSTAEQVSDLSGRGVGMDVVRKNIAELGGNVSVKSEPGVGSTFTIRLPLTLAILDGQLVEVGKETFIIPLISMLETIQINAGQVSSIAGEAEMFKLRESYIPIVRMYELFGIESNKTGLLDGLLVVVEAEGQRVGLFVDELCEQQQVVIKSLETNFKQVLGVSGVTILGDGTVALILDIPGLIRLFYERNHKPSPALVA